MANRDFQVIFNNANNLPRDRYVNTLYYDTRDDGTAEGTAEDIMDGIHAAYTANGLSFLSGSIASMTIKAYATGRNPGGPLAEKNYAFAPSTSAGPAEVAVCLSYYSGGNSKRRRGRVYIGPFAGTQTGSERPSSILRTRILDWASDIAAIGNLSPANWQQHSRTDASYNPVTDFYVDDAWDTQRRRGAAPSGRFTRTV
jgi:hypothetical protein